mgnify:CR=1 FL=1
MSEATDKALVDKIKTLSFRFKTSERKPYGYGSAGKYVSAKETGGLPIFVPSFGAMEQAEVDYVAEVAVGQERERVKDRKALSEQNALTKEALGNIVETVKGQPEGKRIKVTDEIMREGLR